ncbi:MAG: aminoacyl--tRNA ligase-related protein [Candidatus Liptonbacteria bacterium]
MLQSELFSRTARDVPADEVSLNAKLLIRGGFIDKLMAGVYSYLPLGLRVLKNVERIIREEMEAVGGQEILMPSLQPKANWVKTGRWESLDSLFRFESFYSKNDYALGPTHEEVVSPLAKKVIFSYHDLPQNVFQIQTKFRDEKRAKSGLLRGREFLMKDMYSFHVDEADLDRYYEIMKGAYKKVFDRVGIGDSTYLSFASGGTFAKYSHEFQTIISAGEDTVYLCEKCGVAVNKEIINEQSTCPECGNADLKEMAGAEVGNIFKLKTRYSVPFELKYKDLDGAEKDVIMGCYGMGVSRLIGVIVEKSHDDRGIIWPASVAPFPVHLLEINGASAKELYEELEKKGIHVLYDDRDATAGEKFADADLIGLPVRLVVSPKTGDKIEIKLRNESESRLITKGEAMELL